MLCCVVFCCVNYEIEKSTMFQGLDNVTKNKEQKQTTKDNHEPTKNKQETTKNEQQPANKHHTNINTKSSELHTSNKHQTTTTTTTTPPPPTTTTTTPPTTTPPPPLHTVRASCLREKRPCSLQHHVYARNVPVRSRTTAGIHGHLGDVMQSHATLSRRR